MKNFFFLFAFFTTTTLFAQPAAFEKLVSENLSQITQNTTTDQWQTLNQSFSAIAQQHPEKWLAHYYAAYANMQLAGTYEDQTLPIVATHLNQAQAALDKTIELAPNQSEVLVLQGFIYVARIWESPFLNGGRYGRKVSKLFQQAIEIEPNNPRAYYLKGLLTFHTPRFVGGGATAAKPWLITAKEKFEAFNFDSDIMPYWGALENEQLLGECGGSDTETAGQK